MSGKNEISLGNGFSCTDGEVGLMQQLDEILQNATRYQEETLDKILKDNANCEYLSRCGLMSGATKEDFKQCIPIIDYIDIEEFVERIADGDTSPVLCNYPIHRFVVSSGSTRGKFKKFPMTSNFVTQYATAAQYMDGILRRTYPFSDYPGLHNGKVFSIFNAGIEFNTKAGCLVRSMMTSLLRSEKFKEKYSSFRYTSPIDVVLSGDNPDVLYCHLLCGLVYSSEVWSIETGFAFTMDATMRMFQQSWKDLCKDIRDGTLNETITDEKMRKAVLNLLRPNPELASFIEKECSKLSWKGIVRRIWPNAVHIQCIATGPVMKPYVSRINYFSDNLPIMTKVYGATEGGILGLNMDIKRSPAEVAFTFMPTTAFYEFIPLRLQEETMGGKRDNFTTESDKTEIVEFDGLEVGRHYEIVITTFQGLYRYRLADVIKVTGFNKESPMFEYICRRNVSLSVIYDKTDEEELERVMEKASKFLKEQGIEVLDYTTCVDHSCGPGHYVIYMEADEYSVSISPWSEEMDRVMQECSCLLDSSFNQAYRAGRSSGLIGALELRVLSRGTFEELFKHSLKQGTSLSQYKPPRCVVSSSLHEILNNRVIKSWKSTVTSWIIFGQ